MRLLVRVLALLAVLIAFGTTREAQAQAQAAPRPAVNVVTIAGGLENPWSLAFLPDGRLLVTERPGRLRIVGRDGRVGAPLAGLPAIRTGGQGGLLDVVLHPAFSDNRTIYFSFAEAGEGGAGTAVARARLGETALEDVRVVFRQQPKVGGGNHFGSRLAFARDGTLFIALGDRFGYREEAQNLNSHLGKVVRVNADGSVPADNPFVNRAGARPEIWSYGHRNIQAAAIHPGSGALWTIEHGARGGDEINRPEAGKNYGWPIITYGRDYSGMRIGEGTAKAGMEQPLHYWDPSIAPSGMAFYTGDAYAGWKGSLFVGALAGRALVRVSLDGTRIVGEERLLRDVGERIRDVRQGPDGLLYLLTDSGDGRILRLDPR